MKISQFFLTSLLALAGVSFARASIEEIPGPEDMGGMVMPTVGINGTTLSYSWQTGMGMGGSWNPATDSVQLQSLGEVTDGDFFDPLDPAVSNYAALLNPSSLGGAGALFSTRYGFMVSMGDSLPVGDFFAIRITSITDGLIGWNNPASNVLTPVFSAIGDTVLWKGNMWHTLFTLAPDAAPGEYSIEFELLVMSGPDPTWDGFISTDLSGYTVNSSYNSLTIPYTFQAVPEPSTAALALLAAGFWALRRRKSPAANSSK